jgi:hypothetical protein
MEMNGFISSWNNEFESYFKNGARFFPQIVSEKIIITWRIYAKRNFSTLFSQVIATII